MFIILVIIFLETIAFAEELIVSIDKNSGIVSVYGSLGEGIVKAEKVSLQVIKNEYDLGAIDLTTDEQRSTDIFENILQAETDYTGEYTFPSFIINPSVGDYYTFIVTGESNPIANVCRKFIPDGDGIAAFLTDINNASNSQNIKDIIASEIEEPRAGLDFIFYNELSDKGKLSVCEKIHLKGDYSQIDVFDEDFLKFSCVVNVIEVTNEQEIMYFLESENSDYIDLYKEIIKNAVSIEKLSNISTYNDYLLMLDNKKLDICKMIAGKKRNDMEDFYNALDISVINIELVNIVGYKDVKKVLNSHNERLSEINFDSYNSLLDDKEKSVNLKIKAEADTGFEDVEELCEFVNEAVNEVNESQPPPPPTGEKSRKDTSSPIKMAITASSLPDVGINDSDEFTDILNIQWARESINELRRRNIIEGRGNGLFDPNGNVLREEFIKMIIGAFGLYNEYSECEFSDVPGYAWYYKYVASGYEKGIINGMDGNIFGINSNISRQDMIVIMYRVIKLTDIDISTIKPDEIQDVFNDWNETDEYAMESIVYLNKMGIITGDGNSNLNPKSPCTRAEAAKVIYYLMKYASLL